MSNSYVDDIKVKISEKYKPPCRISQPMSYTQHLSLTKQLLDSLPTYEFQVEKTFLETEKVLKMRQKEMLEERKRRLAIAREEFNKKLEQEEAEKLEKEEAEKLRLLEEASKSTTHADLDSQNTYSDPTSSYFTSPAYSSQTSSSQNSSNYITKNGILMPIPISNNYSPYAKTFLNPVPTAATFPLEPAKSNTKQFNLSDFDPDTSSPFDNMELKTLNDFEELQKVLKSEGSNNIYSNTGAPYQTPVGFNANTKSFGSLPQFQPSNVPASVGYTQNLGQNTGYSHGVANTSLSYNKLANSYSQVNANYNPISTTYSPYMSLSTSQVPTHNTHVNGYMYPMQPPSQVQLGYTTNQPSYNPASYTQRTQCKSVPDLVKSLETELDSTHLNDTTHNSRHSVSSAFYTTNDVPVPVRPKSTESVYPKGKIKDGTVRLLDGLSTTQQKVCREISGMGFPLDRVVRVCRTVGYDQKQVVDHLLVLSQLLDLGFSETAASEALLKNDNDRDKALDLLIS